MKNLINTIKLKLSKIDKGTLARTVLMAVSKINDIVAVVGTCVGFASPWYLIPTAILELVSSVVAYWYNNDWSDLALLTRDVFDLAKDKDITTAELKGFIDSHKGDKAV